MNPKLPPDYLSQANRIHFISSRFGGSFKLRIEQVNGEPLTDYVERSDAETRYATQMSIFVGSPKEDRVCGDGIEDYRMPIVNEEILMARLFPER